MKTLEEISLEDFIHHEPKLENWEKTVTSLEFFSEGVACVNEKQAVEYLMRFRIYWSQKHRDNPLNSTVEVVDSFIDNDDNVISIKDSDIYRLKSYRDQNRPSVQVTPFIIFLLVRGSNPALYDVIPRFIDSPFKYNFFTQVKEYIQRFVTYFNQDKNLSI